MKDTEGREANQEMVVRKGRVGRGGGVPESVLQKQNPTWIQDVLVLVIRAKLETVVSR